MTVKKQELLELQKFVSKELRRLQVQINPDSQKIFNLNIADSNISLLLFEDDDEILVENKVVLKFLKEWRIEKSKQNIQGLINSLSAKSDEIKKSLEELKVNVQENSKEKIFTQNVETRLDVCIQILSELADLKNSKENSLNKFVSSKVPMNVNFAAKLMGAKTSEKKAASSRENGKKGGRPKKVK